MKTQTQLENEFKAAVKGTNFMTPLLHGYYEIAEGVAELTSGSGMFGGSEMYGVTVVRGGKQVLSTDPIGGKCLYSKRDALTYIDALAKSADTKVAEFHGRTPGAQGIDHKIVVRIPRGLETDAEIRGYLYAIGYEHISPVIRIEE